MSVSEMLKLLHEAEGHIVVLKTTTGEVFRGTLVEADDNLNCEMAGVTSIYRNGQVGRLENVYVRGNKVRSIMSAELKDGPMLQLRNGNGPRVDAADNNRGLVAVIRARAPRRRGRAELPF
ncbi:small nuclear ribonucleoprotein Sm D3 [Nephila pilipes]|uniref:Small nuclear ribonucleoprotein Sm D3 n=1 Tax=Nephila pilipes TaxID=299642 RepID=A0A8X6N0Y7_NEPPI|nr:small nuclear ribonucleoprotein Sm D3 [Nephila pilipes]